jgi:hypothetical protein
MLPRANLREIGAEGKPFAPKCLCPVARIANADAGDERVAIANNPGPESKEAMSSWHVGRSQSQNVSERLTV